MGKRAFITGCAGQDGSYLAELLLREGYTVHGLVRPSGEDRLTRLRQSLDNPNFHLQYGDVNDPSLPFHVAAADFDEVYHLAAQTHVMQSYDDPEQCVDTNTRSTAQFLNALWKRSPTTGFYFAATSEMFGDMHPGERADENYPLGGRSPYAACKIASHILCRVFRNRGLFVVSGIAFNHESQRRGEEFVTRRIGLGVRQFKKTGKPVTLGNVESCRDWHHAYDTMYGAYRAMQADEPGEYVFASGRSRSVKDFALAVCDYLDAPFHEAIKIDKARLRPWDVDYLCGNPGKAVEQLFWSRRYHFEDLVKDVCEPATE